MLELEDAQSTLDTATRELNERLRTAGYNLHYHNGYLQLSVDNRILKQIEEPCWALIADPKWTNVDIDLKGAFDQRDRGGRDLAWYAARALESTIKIVSKEKGRTHGGEKGVHAYIDNLGSKKNGEFIAGWERDCLKKFFSDVRADLGHVLADKASIAGLATLVLSFIVGVRNADWGNYPRAPPRAELPF